MAVCNACYPFGGMNQVIDHAGCKSQFCRQMSLADNVRYCRCEGGAEEGETRKVESKWTEYFFLQGFVGFLVQLTWMIY